MTLQTDAQPSKTLADADHTLLTDAVTRVPRSTLRAWRTKGHGQPRYRAADVPGLDRVPVGAGAL